MGDNRTESIFLQHGISALFIMTLTTLLQVKYQPMEVSPFDTHSVIMLMFLVALFIYGTASAVEITSFGDPVYLVIAGSFRQLASGLCSVLLLIILVPIMGWIVFGMWLCAVVKLAYDSYEELCKLPRKATLMVLGMARRLIGGTRHFGTGRQPRQSGAKVPRSQETDLTIIK